MEKKEIINLLKKTGVIEKGHFELSSGKHADTYLQCAKILQYPQHTKKLAEEIAALWTDEDIDSIVGPAIGGIVIAYAVGDVMNVRNIFSERKEGKMQFRRSLEVKENNKVLIVEDVVTTGGSVKEVIEIVEKTGAEIIGISSLVDRSGGKAKFKYPFKPLVQLDVEAFAEDNCELCKNNIPINKPGSKNIKS